MELIKGKCPECGGILDIDSSKEALICPYCDTPYIVEKAINNYNAQTIKIENANNININVNNGRHYRTDEDIFKAVQGYLKINEYNKASEKLHKLIDNQPDNPLYWEALLISLSYNFKRETIPKKEFQTALNCLNNYNKLTQQNSQYISLFHDWKNKVKYKEDEIAEYRVQKQQELQNQYSKARKTAKRHRNGHTLCMIGIVMLIIFAFPLWFAFDAIFGTTVIPFVFIFSIFIALCGCSSSHSKKYTLAFREMKEYEKQINNSKKL